MSIAFSKRRLQCVGLHAMIVGVMTADDALTIRRATRSDEPFLIQLARRLAEFEVPAWRTANEIAGADANTMITSVEAARQDDEVLIAERRGVPVGCLHMVSVRDFFGREHAHISVIATTKVAEGTGVGRALMAHAETWSRERDLSLLTLNVFAANSRARRVYAAMRSCGLDVSAPSSCPDCR